MAYPAGSLMSASWRGSHPMLERSRRPARPAPVDWAKVAVLLVVVLADLALLALFLCAPWLLGWWTP